MLIQNINWLLSRIKPAPEEWFTDVATSPKSDSDPLEKKKLDPLPCSSWKELLEAWEGAMPGTWTTDLDTTLSIMLATAMSTMLLEEQIWLRLISVAGSAKSTLCEALSVSEYTHPMGMFTGLHSGMDKNGEDTSIIPRINTRTMIINEGDMLLKCPQKDQFNAQLRDLYTGVARCHYRNGKEITYGGLRTSVILAGTPAIRELNKSALGDRFLDCEVFTETNTSRKRQLVLTVLKKKRKNMLVQSNCDARSQGNPEMVRAFQMTGGYLNWLRETGINRLEEIESRMPLSMDAEFESLGQLVAWMRTRPHGGEEDRTEAELHIRLGAQLQKLALCTAVTMNRDVDEEVLRRTAKVAKDTSYGTTFNIARVLAKETDLCDTQLKDRIANQYQAVSLDHLRKSLDTLAKLKCIESGLGQKGTGIFGGKKHLYRLSFATRSVLNKLNKLGVE